MDPSEGMLPIIRPTRPEDADAIRRFEQDAYGHYVARLAIWVSRPVRCWGDYDRRIANEQAWVLEHGPLAGVLVMETRTTAPCCWTTWLRLGAGQGARAGAVAFAEAEARRRGLPEVRLYTNALMTENLALHGQLGFCETGRVSEKGYERGYMAKTTAGQS